MRLYTRGFFFCKNRKRCTPYKKNNFYLVSSQKVFLWNHKDQHLRPPDWVAGLLIEALRVILAGHALPKNAYTICLQRFTWVSNPDKWLFKTFPGRLILITVFHVEFLNVTTWFVSLKRLLIGNLHFIALCMYCNMVTIVHLLVK